MARYDADTNIAPVPIEIIFVACAALYHNVSECDRERIRQGGDLQPSSFQGQACDPAVQAAFTAFLRHPFSSPSAVENARRLGRKKFLDLATKYMQRYMLQRVHGAQDGATEAVNNTAVRDTGSGQARGSTAQSSHQNAQANNGSKK